MSSINFTSFTNAARNSADLEQEEIFYREGHITRERISARGEPTLRRETWKIFYEVMRREFGEERVEKISLRYFRRSFTQIIDQSPRLLSLYVEMFAVGCANLNVAHLQEKLGKNRRVEDCTSQEIQQLCLEAYPAEYIGQCEDPRELRGGPSQVFEYLQYDLTRQDQKRLNLYRGIENLKDRSANILKENHPFLQRLSMAIVHHDMQVGDIVEAPGDGGEKDFYKLHKNISRDGLYAIALIPVSKRSPLRPILAFRPTETSLNAINAVESWFNNLQKFNGALGYHASRSKLEALMNDPEFYNPDYKPIVVAYSLGGAFAGYFLREFWPKIWQSVFFNSVSNSEASVAEEMAAAVNKLPPDADGPLIYIYRNVTKPDGKEGDWAHFLGEKHVGWGITQPRTLIEITEAQVPFPTPTNFIEWMNIHRIRFLDGPEGVHYPTRIIRKEEIDQNLDNKQRGEEVYHFEVMRQKVGVDIIYYVFNIAYEILKFLFRILGIKIFRSHLNEVFESAPSSVEQKEEA